MKQTITLVPNSDNPVQVTKEVAEMSGLIRSILIVLDSISDLKPSGGPEDVQLPGVSHPILIKIVGFLEKHVNEPMVEITKPIQSNDMYQIVDRWDANYINSMTQEELFQVIHAAKYLDIPSLLDLSACKLASMILGKTSEEIGSMFNVTLN